MHTSVKGVIDTGAFVGANVNIGPFCHVGSEADVWLFKLDGNNNESELWSKLDAVEGNNVIITVQEKIKETFMLY